jgi:hypothetical protein
VRAERSVNTNIHDVFVDKILGSYQEVLYPTWYSYKYMMLSGACLCRRDIRVIPRSIVSNLVFLQVHDAFRATAVDPYLSTLM